jgi:hypothetical protein
MQKLVNWFRQWRERRIVERYKSAGLEFGDACSYILHLGKCVGFERMRRRWARAERAFANAGYRPIPLGDFELAGGWGEPLKDFPQRLAPGEVPVLYAIESEVRGE